MSKVEKQFKQDFENIVKYDKKFDLSQLETNSKPKKKFNPLCIIIPVATAVVIAPLVPFAVFLLPSFDRESSVKEITDSDSSIRGNGNDKGRIVFSLRENKNDKNFNNKFKEASEQVKKQFGIDINNYEENHKKVL